MRGPTPLVMFSGIMNATRYAVVLENDLLPFIEKNYARDHHLQQDNDPSILANSSSPFLAAGMLIGGRLHQKAQT